MHKKISDVAWSGKIWKNSEWLHVLLLFGCYFYLFFISLFPSHETLQVRAIPEQLHGSAESPVLPPSVHGAKIESYHQQTSACIPHGSVGQDLFLGLLIHEALAPAIYWFFFKFHVYNTDPSFETVYSILIMNGQIITFLPKCEVQNSN